MKKSRRAAGKKKPSPSHKRMPCPLSSRQAKVYLLRFYSLPPLNHLSSTVIREVCSYLASVPVLIFPQERYLHYFDASKGNWSCVAYPQDGLFNEFTRYLHLGDETVFACGGTRESLLGPSQTRAQLASNCALLLSLPANLERLADMKVGRVTPGLVELYSEIFAFGGSNKSGYFGVECFVSGESFSLIEGEWSDLPAMKYGRREFCPCVWRREIYLCGGGSTVVEAYSPATSVMREVPVRIQGVEVMAISFLRGEEFVGLSNSFVAVLRYGGEEVIAAVEEKKTLELFQKQLPVVWQGKAYIALSNGCIAIDTKTLGAVDRYPIS